MTDAPVAPAAPAVAPDIAPPATSAAPADSGPWYGELPETLKPHETFYSQFKDRDSFLKSAADTKAALSKRMEGLVRIPGAGSSPDDIAAFRTAMGIPDSPDGYEIAAPQLPEGIDWDPAALEPFKALAHAEGVPSATLSKLVELQAKIESESFVAQQAEIQAAEQALANEWGDSYDYRIDDIQSRVGDALDLSKPFLSRADVLRALDLFAEDYRQDSTGQGRAPTQTGMSLEEEIAKITASDEYRSSANPGHKGARDRLHQLFREQSAREAAQRR